MNGELDGVSSRVSATDGLVVMSFQFTLRYKDFQDFPRQRVLSDLLRDKPSLTRSTDNLSICPFYFQGAFTELMRVKMQLEPNSSVLAFRVLTRLLQRW